MFYQESKKLNFKNNYLSAESQSLDETDNIVPPTDCLFLIVSSEDEMQLTLTNRSIEIISSLIQVKKIIYVYKLFSFDIQPQKNLWVTARDFHQEKTILSQFFFQKL